MEFLVQLTSPATRRSNSMGMGSVNGSVHDSVNETSSLKPLSNVRTSSCATTTSVQSSDGDNAQQQQQSLERLPIHGRHTCDSCNCTPIVGNRYHGTGNLLTGDMDLCDKCHANYQEGNVAKFVLMDLEERDVPFQELWHRRRLRWRDAGLRPNDMDFSLQEVERQLHQLKLRNQLKELDSKANELFTTQSSKHPDEVSIVSPTYSYQEDEMNSPQHEGEEQGVDSSSSHPKFDKENADAAAKEFQFSLGEEWFQFFAQVISKSDPRSKVSEVHMFNGSVNDQNTELLANALLHDKKIATLHIQSNRFSRKAADTFKGLFQEPTTIHTLDFSFNRITGSYGIQSIAGVLPFIQNLRELFLRDCGIGDDGVKTMVVEGLKNNTTLRVLDLWRNNITDEGAEALGTISFFRRKTAFKILYMGCNKIGNVGVQRLTAGLKHSANLQCLNLSINRIGDDGAIAIGSLIPRLKRLKMMVLSRNMIGDQGAAGIAEGLATKTSSLVLLDLSSNRISDLGAKLVGKMLQQNGGLQKLFLHSNKLKMEGERAVMNGIKQNVLLDELDVYLFPNEDANSDDHMTAMNGSINGSSMIHMDSERSTVTRSTAMSTPSSTPPT